MRAGLALGSATLALVLIVVIRGAPLDSGLVVGLLVAAYAAGLVTVAALRRPTATLIDWRIRRDRARWRRLYMEERERRLEAERRLKELRALAGYRGRF